MRAPLARTLAEAIGLHLEAVRAEYDDIEARGLKLAARGLGSFHIAHAPRGGVGSLVQCTVPELLEKHPRLAITGPRGFGKTMLVAQLAASAARKSLEHEDWIPFVVPVYLLPRPCIDDDTLALLAPILALDGVRHVLAQRRMFLLVDGLDEADDDATALAESIRVFAQANPRHRIVVMSRPRRSTIPGLRRAEIPGFATAALLPPPGNPLYNAYDFAGRRSPQRRAALLGAQIETALLARDGVPGSVLARFHLAHRILLVNALAATLHGRRLLEASEAEVAEIVGRRLVGLRCSADETRLFLDDPDADEDGVPGDPDDVGRMVVAPERLIPAIVAELPELTGLVVLRRPGVLAFADLALQEYLTALNSVRNPPDQIDLITQCEDRWWREVTVLFASLPGVDAAKYIRGILDAHYEMSAVGTLIAARCVEVAGDLPEPLKRAVARRLAALVPPHNGINAAHLIDVGEVAGPALLAALEGADPNQRANTATVLGMIGYLPGCGPLERMASDATLTEGDLDLYMLKSEYVASEQPVALFALAALLMLARTTAAGQKAFERALPRVPLATLRNLRERMYGSLEIDVRGDQSERDRDRDRMFVAKLESEIGRKKAEVEKARKRKGLPERRR